MSVRVENDYRWTRPEDGQLQIPLAGEVGRVYFERADNLDSALHAFFFLNL
jgi:hypothetical protein